MKEAFETQRGCDTLSRLVKLLRFHSPARLLTVALMMISWFIATNHCAFGLMKPTPQKKAEHASCHSNKKTPEKGAPADGVRQCCKAIHGTPATAKAEVKFDATKFQLHLFALLQMLAAPQGERAPASLVFDHGPPRAVSFAESVLQRSLLGHAPPLV